VLKIARSMLGRKYGALWMRRFLLAGLIAMGLASTAHAQKPRTACPDLAITYHKQVASIPGMTLEPDQIAFRYTVRNVGRAPLVAASDSTQWISLEVLTGTGSLGVNVLPPSAPPGPVTIAPGARMDGFIVGRFLPVLPPTVPLFLQLNYAAASAGGPADPQDCSTANNRVRVSYRRR